MGAEGDGRTVTRVTGEVFLPEDHPGPAAGTAGRRPWCSRPAWAGRLPLLPGRGCEGTVAGREAWWVWEARGGAGVGPGGYGGRVGGKAGGGVRASEGHVVRSVETAGLSRILLGLGRDREEVRGGVSFG